MGLRLGEGTMGASGRARILAKRSQEACAPRTAPCRTNLRLWAALASPDPLFPVVLYNEWRNLKV
jgi:hypothetical protein